MSLFSLLFQICTDELYLITFFLFTKSVFNLKPEIRLSSIIKKHIFLQIMLFIFQFNFIRKFPFAPLYLWIMLSFYTFSTYSNSFKHTQLVIFKYFIANLGLAILLNIILFFRDFFYLLPQGSYEKIVLNDANYYILKDASFSSVAGIIITIFQNTKNLKKPLYKIKYNFILLLTLISIIFSFLLFTYVYIYSINNPIVIYIVIIAVLIIILLLAFILCIYNQTIESLRSQFLLDQRLRKAELEKNYFNSISDALSKMAKLRHDFKNYLTVLQQYLSEGDITGASSFIKKISEKAADPIHSIITNNYTISAILNTKQNYCLHNQIAFFTSIDFHKIYNISDIDLITLLGNILDNAITASKKLELEKRSIHLHISQIDSYLLITCKNNFDGVLKLHHEQLLSTKPDNNPLKHGIGLSNIRDVVEQNNGTWKYTYDKTTFTVEVILPNYK